MTVLARHDQDYGERIAALEASRERGLWVEFTPNVHQGSYLAKAANTFAYYHYSQGVMRVEIFAQLNAAGTANNVIRVSGWPVAYNIASSGERFPVGVFQLYDANTNLSYDGHAVTYYDDLAGFSFTATVGRLLYGQTNSGAAVTLAADDEIAISASWRV
jgi:hypothetical protein